MTNRKDIYELLGFGYHLRLITLDGRTEVSDEDSADEVLETDDRPDIWVHLAKSNLAVIQFQFEKMKHESTHRLIEKCGSLPKEAVSWRTPTVRTLFFTNQGQASLGYWNLARGIELTTDGRARVFDSDSEYWETSIYEQEPDELPESWIPAKHRRRRQSTTAPDYESPAKQWILALPPGEYTAKEITDRLQADANASFCKATLYNQAKHLGVTQKYGTWETRHLHGEEEAK